MERIEFNHKTTRTVVDKRAVNFQEFCNLIDSHKPKKLRCDEWSSKEPIYTIIRYLGDQKVIAIAHAVDREAQIETSYEKIFKSLRYGGLSDTYFLVSE